MRTCSEGAAVNEKEGGAAGQRARAVNEKKGVGGVLGL